jgi:sulfite exporter TauE/SafE
VLVVVIAVVLVVWLAAGDIGSRLGDPGAGGMVAVFVIGLTAGVSTCMALVGGLVLAVSASRVASASAGVVDRWRPHLAFQAGRVAGFFVLGAGLGAIGARLSLPAPVQAALLLVVAIFMALLGIRLTGVSPRLSGWSLALPGSWTRRLGLDDHASRPYSDARTALLGAATFFLPCGFTQVVQLYAMTTASPLQSGAVMAVFALGTAPGLLALGGLPSLASGARRARVLAVVGVALVVFAAVNVTSAAGLVGWRSPSHAALTSAGVTSNVSVSGGVQTVTMAQGSRGYSPDTSVVYAGLPIRWVITSESAYTCAAYLRQVAGDWRYDLTTGVNIVDVPALPAGASFDFTCVMGMYSGTLVATDRTAPRSG